QDAIAAASALRFCQRYGAPRGITPNERGGYRVHTCFGAAQLTVAPDKTPNAAPAGRAGSCNARRTASRRLQTLNVKFSCIAASGVPRPSARTWMRLAGERFDR